MAGNKEEQEDENGEKEQSAMQFFVSFSLKEETEKLLSLLPLIDSSKKGRIRPRSPIYCANRFATYKNTNVATR